MLAFLAIAGIGLTERTVDAIPAEPLLAKFETTYMLPYVKRLNPTEPVHVGVIGDVAYLATEIPKLGGTVITKTKSVITATVPAGQVAVLAANPRAYKVCQGFLPTSGMN